MFNTGNCPSVPIVANLDGNNGNNWNDGSWLWFLIVVFAIFGGWGNGFGGFGGTNGGVGSEIQRGFDNQAVISKLDGISNGLCDGFYAMNNSMLTGFNGINTNIMQTGYGIQQAVNADTVANMQNTNALQSQLANCCCETREAIQGVNYNMATNTCALQNTMNNNTRDIIDSQNAGFRSMFPTSITGSSSTYYPDGCWFNIAIIAFALFGGPLHAGRPCGAFYVNLGVGAGAAGWSFGASLSYK